MSRERSRSTTQGAVGVAAGDGGSKTAADDDDSGSAVDDGSGGDSSDNGSKPRRSLFGSAASSAPSGRRHQQRRRRWGSMNRGELSVEDAPCPSATALAQEREKLLRAVFGQQAGAEELATVGRSNSCHVFLEAAGRIAALPPLERSLLAELDRSSDDEGEGGGGGGGSCSDGDYGGGGDDVAPQPPFKEGSGDARSSDGVLVTAGLSPAGNRELPLLRVGRVEAGRDAPPTTAYRYRRLAGKSGRGWPPRVDPAHREEWLCPIEFEAVFGMKFADFEELPSWKRVLLKQDVHLF